MTESLARISAQRPWVVISVWVVLLAIAAALISQFLGSATTTDFRLAGRYESERADSLLEEKLRGPKLLAEIVIVQSPSLTVQDDAFRAKVEAVHGGITALGPETISGGINNSPVSHYYQVLDAGPAIPQEQLQQLLPLLVSASERTVMMHYTLVGTSQEATANVEDVIHVVEEADAADDFRVLIGGDASIAFENNELARHDLENGERFGIPIALIVLLLLFGAVVATILPVGLAVVAIIIALAEVYVGGVTAEATDFFGIVDVYTPIAFAFVLGLSFIILMMVFRSIVIPVKAIIMNLLSIGATYGLLVLVFQKDFGAGLLGFQHAEVIDAWIPLFLFTILFGLSMDYHVFLLSRIRERYDETGDNTGAVAYGLQSTGG